MIPDTHKDLLEKPIHAVLTTLMPDGQPQSSVVWFNYADGAIHLNSTKGRQKDRNMRRDARVTLLLLDPENPYHWIEIRGQITAVTEDGALEHIDDLTQRYTGLAHFYGGYASAERRHTETRVRYTVTPRRVITYPKSAT
jgi:PPOX class probable F420-dependent enzyme